MSPTGTIRRIVVADARSGALIELPRATPGARYVIEATSYPYEAEGPEARRRKRAELEALAGSFADLPLERPPQPPFGAAPDG